jgi:RNA polymerase sigma-70 factor (ECF subfamily)
MFATVWRILRHPQDAEDALQNALVTIWRRRTQVESHPAPRALILRICADAAIDQFRRRHMDHVDVETFENRLPSRERSPLDGLISEERLDIVMAAISRLSPNQSTAIVMKYLLAESHAEIAAALGCTKETVREHLARARERLRQMLKQLETDRLPVKVSKPVAKENEK